MINYKKYSKQLTQLESNYTYKSDEIYYYNVHRPTSLVKTLQKRYEHFDYSLIPEIVEHALGKKVIDYHYKDNAGTGHLIIFVEVEGLGELVLRTNLSIDEVEEYMEFEKEFSELYEKTGIPSSKILFSDTSRKEFPFDYQIMEVLPGKDLYLEWEGTRENYENVVFQIGECIAREYKVPMKVKGWGRIKKDDNGDFVGTSDSLTSYLNAYLEHDLKVLELFEFISAEDSKKIQNYFESGELKELFSDMSHGYLVHNDPSDLNMRYEGDQFVSLFDWENAVIYDPICELGTAPTWSTVFPKKEKMVEGFISELGYKPDNLEKKMAVYFLRKIIDKVQFALRGERLAEKHIGYFKEGVADNGLNVKVLVEI